MFPCLSKTGKRCLCETEPHQSLTTREWIPCYCAPPLRISFGQRSCLLQAAALKNSCNLVKIYNGLEPFPYVLLFSSAGRSCSLRSLPQICAVRTIALCCTSLRISFDLHLVGVIYISRRAGLAFDTPAHTEYSAIVLCLQGSYSRTTYVWLFFFLSNTQRRLS